VVPPVALTVAVPVDAPLQRMFVLLLMLAVSSVGSVIVKLR